jgi:hypothetical protein
MDKLLCIKLVTCGKLALLYVGDGVMVWLIILCILLLLIVILLLFQLKIRIQYCFQKNNHHIVLHVYYMKIRVFHRKINFNEYAIDETELMNIIQDFKTKDKKFNVKDMFRNGMSQLKNARNIMLILIKSISIQKLSWITHFGTGEASSTGTLAGGVWMVKGTLVGLLYEQTEMSCQPKISVIPHFQQKGLYTEVDCIVSIRLGKAIHTGMHLLRNLNMKEVYT